MSSYKTELWIGELEGGGCNWELRGISYEDWFTRLQMCKDMGRRLLEISEFYQHLVDTQKETLEV